METTSTEDYLNMIQAQREITSKGDYPQEETRQLSRENDLNGGKPQREMSSTGDELKGRQVQRETSSIGDKLNGRQDQKEIISKEDKVHWRKAQRVTRFEINRGQAQWAMSLIGGELDGR